MILMPIANAEKELDVTSSMIFEQPWLVLDRTGEALQEENEQKETTMLFVGDSIARDVNINKKGKRKRCLKPADLAEKSRTFAK